MHKRSSYAREDRGCAKETSINGEFDQVYPLLIICTYPYIIQRIKYIMHDIIKLLERIMTTYIELMNI